MTGVKVPGKVALLALYNAIFVLPLAAILIALLVLGDDADKVLRRANLRLQAHWPALLAGLGLVIGAVIAGFGLAGLLAG